MTHDDDDDDCDTGSCADADGWIDVTAHEQLAPGRPLGVRIDGRPVVIARAGDGLHAVGGVCTHAAVLLEEGWIAGTTLFCPAHEAGFDLPTGEATCPPATGSLAVYPICVRGPRVLVNRTPHVRNKP